MNNLSDVFQLHSGQKICVVDGEKSWSYGEIFEIIRRLAYALSKRGVRSGDVVALIIKDDLNSLVFQLAVARIGATILTLSPNMPSTRCIELFESVSAAWIVSDVNVTNLGLPSLTVDEVLLDAKAEQDEVDCIDQSPTHPWIIVIGSGSTGKPKLMPVTHAQQITRMQLGQKWLPYKQSDVFVSLISLDFYTTKQRYLEAFVRGASICFVKNEISFLTNLIEQRKVSVVYGTVFHLEHMLSLSAEIRSRYKVLTAIIVAGSTASMNFRQRIVQHLCERLFVIYGTNESSIACVTSIAELLKIPGNVGRPYSGFEVEVVDSEGKNLPVGTTGLIRMKSDCIINGYLKDEVATRERFRDGWFYPGDLGELTTDGQLIFKGRSDDLMIMNGINIYPLEIEYRLSAHPYVKQVVAFPVHHDVHQDIPACAVVIHDGAVVDEQTLHRFAAEKLGSACPRILLILEKIPLTDWGKVDRKALLDIIRLKNLNVKSPPQKLSSDEVAIPDLNSNSPIASLPPAQLTLRLELNFHLPAHIDLSCLDYYLEKLVAAPPDLDFGFLAFAVDNKTPAPVSWLLRVLRMAHLALLVARLPVFNAPKVLRCIPTKSDGSNQASGAWSAVLAIAHVDEVSPAVYSAVLKASIKLSEFAAEQVPGPETVRVITQRFLAEVLSPLRALSYPGKSTLMVLREAYKRGIPFMHLGAGCYQLGWGHRAVWLDRSTIERDSAIGSKMTQAKDLTASLLRRSGLPAPQHIMASTLEQAAEAATRLGWPVVVKPSDSDRGEGVTVDVVDADMLASAFRAAHKASAIKRVLVERQVMGVCHRLFVVGDRLLYAVKRWPMSVHGDGRSTVAQLVERAVLDDAQLPPWHRSGIRPLDDLAQIALSGAGLTPASVPLAGARVLLRRIESTEWGGVDEEVSAIVHPENLRVALAAARLFRLDVAGVDIISADISRPWYENGAITNEVNFAPLLGGAEISRQHLGDYLSRVVEGTGRIPVEVFVGGSAAWQAALARQASLGAHSVRAWLTSGKRTLAPEINLGANDERDVLMPLHGVKARVRALVMAQDVEALLLVVDDDQLLDTGLPLDQVDAVHLVEHSLKVAGQNADSPRFDAMINLMRAWAAGRIYGVSLSKDASSP